MAEPVVQDGPTEALETSVSNEKEQEIQSQKDKQLKERHLIHPGSQLLIRLPTGEIRHIHVDEKLGERSVNLGKFGSFRVKELVGHPFGLTYEIQKDKSLVVLPPQRLEELEETGATNEMIVDGGEFVQPLTSAEIETLKKSGLHASEIIKRQIETHANYELKTEYSKDKYKKRKEAKFAKQITVLEPTLYNVARYYFEKDSAKILGLRIDTLSQMANLANLGPGGRFLIVDTIGGLLVAAALDRLGGSGKVLYLSETDTPPQIPMLAIMNMTEEQTGILGSLDWAAADEEYEPIRAPTEAEGGEYRSQGQKERYEKRKLALEALEQVREELFAGEWDGLLIAAHYEPFSIVQKLQPYLAGSATITIYSQFLQILSQCQSKMRPIPSYLNPSITEAWLREYQVLPGRTHPMMNMTGGGGYLLHALHVYDDPAASSALAGLRGRLRERRREKKEKDKEREARDSGQKGEGVDAENPSASKRQKGDNSEDVDMASPIAADP